MPASQPSSLVKLKVNRFRFSVELLEFFKASIISFFLSGDLIDPLTAYPLSNNC